MSVVLDFPGQQEWDLAEVFAKCADRAGGFDDMTQACPICGRELNDLAPRHRAMDHLDGCFWDLATRIRRTEAADLGQLAYDADEAAIRDVAGARYVRETPATYSIIPTTRTRRRITVDGRSFAVGDHVAVLARPLPGQGDEDRPVVCTAYIDGIAERCDDYNITPREVTFGLVGVLSPDGQQIAGLRTAIAPAELLAPIGTRELGL